MARPHITAWFRNRGLSERLVLAILLVITPVILTVILTLGSLSASFLRTAAEKELAVASHSAASSIDQWDHYFVLTLQNLRGQPDILHMNPDEQRPVLQQLKKVYNRLDIVRVTRPDGISVVRTDGTTPISYADRDWFKACMAGAPVYRQALITRTTGKPALNISTPIYGETGKIVGVLSAVTKLDAMADILGLSTAGQHQLTFLVDASGHALAHPNVRTAETLCDLSQYPPVKAAMLGQTGSLSFTDAFGGQWLSGSDRLPNGWFVVSQITEGEALSRRTGMMQITHALAAGTFVVVITLTWWIGRKLLRPIRALTHAAGEMAAGNLEQKISTGGGEIAALAGSFLKMRDAIRQKIHGLDREIIERQLAQSQLAVLNQTLEKRVVERTRELSQSNAMLHKLSCAVEQTSAAVMITSLRGIIEWVNSAAVVSTGYSAQELVGQNPRMLQSGLVPDETYRQMWVELSRGSTWRGELQNRRKGGPVYWVLAVISPIKDLHGTTTHYLSLEEDITARKNMEEELRLAARTDRLTGLPNRALLCDRLQQSIHRAKRLKDYGFALLFIDFDHFKVINDSLGHETGDILLTEISKRLRDGVRAMDSVSRPARESTAARLGGDEFVILLDGVRDQSDVVAIAERLLSSLAEPYLLADREVFSTASMGIVTSNVAGSSAEEILRDADTAMYEAKLAGRSRYKLFDASMRARVLERLAMEHDLRKAIDGGQLFLNYQPIVSMETGQIESFEVLVRWQHPQRGLISPAQFIPVAEECGLIVPIGQWVLREACRHYARWRATMGDQAPPGISVNLSRAQLMLPDLPAIVRGIITDAGIEPGCLHLEITESAVMRDPQHAVQVLQELKQIGVKLDLDDFGTGYSSLASLHMFPLDVLKIDRSFVANVNRGRHFAALVQAVTQLAQNLGMTVVAEGVETEEQLHTLQSLDCHFAQGFLFSKPLGIERAMEFRVEKRHLPAEMAACAV
jgi:diguanylate cyclase (GGDEF)-like protein/PAS domain S-box-containing protein